MFESEKCRFCGKGLKKDWIACPYCGKRIDDRRLYDISEDIEREFERIDKIFGPMFIKFPRLNMESPFKGGGISITIKRGTGRKPRVEVRTAGDYRKIEPEIKKKLGVRGGIEVQETKKKYKMPKITEEPEMKVEKKGNKESISIKLPDVKNISDIEIRKLEQSLEIKAFAGDKAYFKLIPIKPHVQISDRSFKNGVLKIELMR